MIFKFTKDIYATKHESDSNKLTSEVRGLKKKLEIKDQLRNDGPHLPAAP